MSAAFSERPDWSFWATGQPPTVLAVWDGVPTVFLAPTSRGAIIWWEFDVDGDDSRYVLLAHLTEIEAQAVFDAAPDTGALEPVRHFMADNRAVIARRHPSFCSAERYVLIPREVDEEQFSAFLDAIHDDLAREELPHPEHQRRRKQTRKATRIVQRSDDSLLDALAHSAGVPV